MRYDFVDLSIFLTLSRTLNVTHTAEEVHLTTAAVSVRLKKFEEALGVKLFERGPRGMTMTAAATALKPHVLSIWGTLNAIEGEMRTYQTPAADTITIATNSTGMQNVFCHAARIFLERHCVRCRLIHSRSAATVEAVIRGNVDMGFGLQKYADLHRDAVEVVPFMKDRIVAILPDTHPLAEKEAIDYATFLQYDHLALQDDAPITKAMRERARNRGCQFNPLIQLPNFDQMIRYVEARVAGAVLPESALSEHAVFPDREPRYPYRIVPLTDSFAERTLAFMLKKDSREEKICRDLIEICREVIGRKSPTI